MREADNYAVRVLEPLRGEPEGPARIDVRRAMRDGRRRRRMRWAGTVAAAVVTVGAVGAGTAFVVAGRGDHAGPATTPTTKRPSAKPPTLDCKVAELPTDGYAKALVTAGDPSGHYLAGRLYEPGSSAKGKKVSDLKIVVWKDGRIVDRPNLPGSEAEIEGINASGDGFGDAYAYRGGAVTELRGDRADAFSINSAGVIVGAVGPDDASSPVRWTSPDAEPDKLPVPAGAHGHALGIDDDGSIVGVLRIGKRETGYLWPAKGEPRAMTQPVLANADKEREALLPKPTGTYFRPQTAANGKVVGSIESGENDYSGGPTVLYDIKTNTYLGLQVMARDVRISDDGRVFGRAGEIGMEYPVMEVGGRTIKLPTGGAKEVVPVSLSSDGKVAAGYSSGSKNGKVVNRPLWWRCK